MVHGPVQLTAAMMLHFALLYSYKLVDRDSTGGILTMVLDNNEQQRYSRQLMLRQVGIEGQEKLKNAKVLLIGAGGLGCPVGLYLAAAGVGTIGLVDFDLVDITNLQRQILFRTKDVGQPKASLAAQRLRELNPHIELQIMERRFGLKNALELVSQYDLVVDGSDNFETRYLTNDACAFQKKALIFGSIYQFEGQITIFDAEHGPCYRCLFPKAPPEGVAPNCKEAGVIGVLPGIVGVLQASETIKKILGIGDPLIGRLLTINALTMQFRELLIKKNPDCPLCGSSPSIQQLHLQAESCAWQRKLNIPKLAPEEFLKWRSTKRPFILLDVRDRKEYEIANLAGHLIPLNELRKRLSELDRNKTIVVHCASGQRSLKACEILQEAGFTDVLNLEGGINAAVKVLM